MKRAARFIFVLGALVVLPEFALAGNEREYLRPVDGREQTWNANWSALVSGPGMPNFADIVAIYSEGLGVVPSWSGVKQLTDGSCVAIWSSNPKQVVLLTRTFPTELGLSLEKIWDRELMATQFPHRVEPAIYDGRDYILGATSGDFRWYMMGTFHNGTAPSLMWLAEIGELIASYVQSKDAASDRAILEKLNGLVEKHLK